MPAEHLRPRCGRFAAGIALFALLLQAILFGWHSHPVPFSAAGQPLALSAPHSGSPLSPADADDTCQICLSLNHIGAAPVIAAPLSLPPGLTVAVLPGEAAQTGSAPSAGFHARAPPARLT